MTFLEAFWLSDKKNSWFKSNLLRHNRLITPMSEPNSDPNCITAGWCLNPAVILNISPWANPVVIAVNYILIILHPTHGLIIFPQLKKILSLSSYWLEPRWYWCHPSRWNTCCASHRAYCADHTTKAGPKQGAKYPRVFPHKAHCSSVYTKIWEKSAETRRLPRLC